eukprot:740_1
MLQHSNKIYLWKLQRIYYGTNQQYRHIEPSSKSMQTINPIRKIFDNLSDYKITATKEFISVAIGDPTKYMDPPPSIKQALSNTLMASNDIHSYCSSNGLASARSAVSKQYTNCTPNNVVITSGCQQALDLAFYSLLHSEDDNVLLPSPCWPEYVTGLDKYGFRYKYYRLLPDKQWQVDTQHLESLIDGRTKAILTNSPSNPCGSILNYETLYNILRIADKYQLPIVSDEIYSNIIFENANKFISYSTVKQNENISVPILITSGLGKNYLIPGWKVGWLVFDDDGNDSLAMIKEAVSRLMGVNFGPSSVCQSMIADIIENTESTYWVDLNKKLYEQNKLFCDLINDTIPELEAFAGHGAFYMMAKIHLDQLKDIENDSQFFQKLLEEQAVFLLPGSLFQMDGYFRAVICARKDVLTEVVQRLKMFCKDHRL